MHLLPFPSRLASFPPTQFVKCGFAGDNFPTAVLPCMVGRPILRYDEGVGQSALPVKNRYLPIRYRLIF